MPGVVSNRTYRAWGKYRVTELFSETSFSLRTGMTIEQINVYGDSRLPLFPFPRLPTFPLASLRLCVKISLDRFHLFQPTERQPLTDKSLTPDASTRLRHLLKILRDLSKTVTGDGSHRG